MAFDGDPEDERTRADQSNPTLGEFVSRERLPSTADIVVIGGGIVGAATIYYLARAGRSPVLIESGPTLANLTTANSSQCVHAQFTDPLDMRMMAESLAIYANFPEELGLPPGQADIRFRPQGHLFATADEDSPDQLRARVAGQRMAGLADVEYLDGDEARYRFPWLAPTVTAATFRAHDGWIDSVAATEAFVRASGAPTFLETEVRLIRREGNRITGVETDRGVIATELVVLAAGPFTQTLAGEPLPLSLVRGHRLIVPAQPEIPPNAPATIDLDTGAYWRPDNEGALLGWRRNEAPGPPLAPVPVNPAFPDLVLRDPDGVGRLTPLWHEVAPRFTPESLWLVAGQYDNTPDRRPLIGPARQTEGLWIHAGYNGHGIMGSPSGARLLADLLTDSHRSGKNPFDPNRFDDLPATATQERSVS